MSCFSILTSKLNSNKSKNQHSSSSTEPEAPLSSSIYQSTQSSNPHPHLACCSFEPLPAYSSSCHPSHAHGRLEEKNQDKPLSPIMQEVAKTVEEILNSESLDKELRKLSLEMWHNPEIMWQEKKTHDLFTSYFDGKPGWKVTRHAYTLPTAYAVEFVHKPSSFVEGKDELRTIGFNAEMDALAGIGHACGHPLIAIAGVGASLAVAEALVKHDIAGRVLLLGTPAEEGGGGKIVMLKEGAYSSMNACLMLHPAPTSMIGSWLAVQPVNVKYKGQTAHAGAAPWEGINALDAAVLAYNNISVLRQQIKPNERVHGILSGEDWSANVIPGNSHLLYNIRAPTKKDLKLLVERVKRCFEAAALATGCEMEIEWGTMYADVQNSHALANSYQNFMLEKFDIDVPWTPFNASSDFGDVTYALPSAQPAYKIHLDNPSTQGNHTVGFADASKSQEAHDRTKEAALGIANVGARIVVDKEYYGKVRKEWEEWKKDQEED